MPGLNIYIVTMIRRIKFLIKQYIPTRFLEFLGKKGILVSSIPTDEKSIISDLFLYKIENGWNTFFELLNYSRILDQKKIDNFNYDITIKFFSPSGVFLKDFKTKSSTFFRLTLDIKKITKDLEIFKNGTFSIFHHYKSNKTIHSKGFLTERGYIGYFNKNISPIKSYIHGNFDAISLNSKNKVKLLGTYSFFTKRFNLQYELDRRYNYDIVLVNTTPNKQKIQFEIHQNNSVDFIKKTIPSKGFYEFSKLNNKIDSNSRLIIKSELYLARPILFKYMDKSFDVFHG